MNRKEEKEGKSMVGGVGVEESGFGLSGRLSSRVPSCPDLDKYRRHVDHFDLTEAQKTDLLLAVWRIMQSFVDSAFGDDPVQQVRPRTDPLQAASETGDDTDDGDTLSGAFSRHAAGKDER